MSKRRTFKVFLKNEFFKWAIDKGYIISGPTGIYEAFRLTNAKKGEILVGHFDMQDKSNFIITGRLSQLVSQWESERSQLHRE